MNLSKENVSQRNITTLILGIAAVFLILPLLFTLLKTSGYGTQMYMGTGFTPTAFLLLSIKILFAVFVTGLILGVFFEGKALYEKQQSQVKSAEHQDMQNFQACSTCGKTLQNEWKLCPFCGSEKASQNAEEV